MFPSGLVNISFITDHQKPVHVIEVVLYEILDHFEFFDFPAGLLVVDSFQLDDVHPVREVWHCLDLTHKEYHVWLQEPTYPVWPASGT